VMFFFAFLLFVTGSLYVAQAVHELTM
jgi:hypothetical protein